MTENQDNERSACNAIIPSEDFINFDARLPYGLAPDNVYQSMVSFAEFLTFVNIQLNSRSISRMEKMLMPANFSSMVGEFMVSNIPKFCDSLVKNKYHNGHPDMIPKDEFPNDSIQYSHIGIEVKASRYDKGWQGHNPEAIFLMVFVFDSNRPDDDEPKPFEFKAVFSGQLELEDWKMFGRGEESRRTPTAAVKPSGYEKMKKNWVYLNEEMRNILTK